MGRTETVLPILTMAPWQGLKERKEGGFVNMLQNKMREYVESSNLQFLNFLLYYGCTLNQLNAQRFNKITQRI